MASKEELFIPWDFGVSDLSLFFWRLRGMRKIEFEFKYFCYKILDSR
jgi:hypothetical protein